MPFADCRKMIATFAICGSMVVTVGTASASNPQIVGEGVVPLNPYLGQQSTITASINGVEGMFLFDTGEGLSTITPAFAEKLGCKPWGRVSGFRMSGERLDTPHCDNLQLVTGREHLDLPVAGVLDLMKFFGPGAPVIDGAIGLDALAGRKITINPRKSLIIETAKSFARRIQSGKELPVRLVRDVEGLALSIDGAVPTASGVAWMELDTGNGGSLVIGNHIAPLLGMAPDVTKPVPVRFELANGLTVEGNARSRDLIMDGNIGAQFLNHWQLSIDLEKGRVWFVPL
ncbi:MAG: aspartyl protease family protein [Bryobacteraceae bacterium]